jgi:hypothetical protein
MRRLLPAALVAAFVVLLAPAYAAASPFARYGVQDDAWLTAGPGTLEQRLDTLERLGVQIVRYTLRWDQIAARRPANARSGADPAYGWGSGDAILKGLQERGIPAMVSIWGTPRWANGGQRSNVAPTSASTFRNFVHAAMDRFPWVRHWLIWNEPNQQRWLRPANARVYTQRLLNPAYAAIKSRRPGAMVGGGVTAPRGNVGGVSPVEWIRGMRAAGARFDAYAHNPYPLRPGAETPFSGGCPHCLTISMADLERLLVEVRRNFGLGKRIWLTEWGYQTNPPERIIGVPPALQARYVAEASLRTFQAPRVDFLINFLVRDDTRSAGWQSGKIWASGTAKPSFRSFMLPLAQVSRTGMRTVVWGQVRPRAGRQPYRLQQFRDGRWHNVGGTFWTNQRGFFQRTLRAGPGSPLRIWSPRDETFSPFLRVR